MSCKRNKLSILVMPYLQLWFGLLLLGLSLTAWSAPSVKVTISAPDGSAAADFSSKLMNNIIYTPCLSSTDTGNATFLGGESINNHFDQLKISLSITNEKDTDGNYLYDLYFMIVNLSASGQLNNNILFSQIYLFERIQDGTDQLDPISVNLFGTAEAADLSSSEKKYLAKELFIADTYEEEIFGNSIYFDSFSLPQGTWLALAILGDGSTLKFGDPKTWAKWDADVFILGSPLKTSIGTSGDGTCN